VVAQECGSNRRCPEAVFDLPKPRGLVPRISIWLEGGVQYKGRLGTNEPHDAKDMYCGEKALMIVKCSNRLNN
jgi:hypothetical protein